eukprot:snap_masked-scaffold_5-processed-gene-11.3-mRNA-1 protein AED:1.00 eAED:1.00 QI:0/0/0/0/1/1/2/0/61
MFKTVNLLHGTYLIDVNFMFAVSPAEYVHPRPTTSTNYLLLWIVRYVLKYILYGSSIMLNV